MSDPLTLELVYFASCPNVEQARENIRGAMKQVGRDDWTEWDLEATTTPEHYKSFGSPTVLVDGHDVLGASGEGSGFSCRAEGAPSLPQILDALEGKRREE